MCRTTSPTQHPTLPPTLTPSTRPVNPPNPQVDELEGQNMLLRGHQRSLETMLTFAAFAINSTEKLHQEDSALLTQLFAGKLSLRSSGDNGGAAVGQPASSFPAQVRPSTPACAVPSTPSTPPAIGGSSGGVCSVSPSPSSLAHSSPEYVRRSKREVEAGGAARHAASRSASRRSSSSSGSSCGGTCSESSSDRACGGNSSQGGNASAAASGSSHDHDCQGCDKWLQQVVQAMGRQVDAAYLGVGLLPLP